MNKVLRKREGEVIVLPLDKDTIDVFVGAGWENWTRLRREGGAFKILQGTGLNREQFAEFLRCLA